MSADRIPEPPERLREWADKWGVRLFARYEPEYGKVVYYASVNVVQAVANYDGFDEAAKELLTLIENLPDLTAFFAQEGRPPMSHDVTIPGALVEYCRQYRIALRSEQCNWLAIQETTAYHGVGETVYDAVAYWARCNHKPLPPPPEPRPAPAPEVGSDAAIWDAIRGLENRVCDSEEDITRLANHLREHCQPMPRDGGQPDIGAVATIDTEGDYTKWKLVKVDVDDRAGVYRLTAELPLEQPEARP
jgi:hypothetical protein